MMWRTRYVTIVMAIAITVAGGLAFAKASSSSPYVSVGHGRIGRYKWLGWLESSETPGLAKDVVCIAIETEAPSIKGSESGETHECGHVRSDSPIFQAVSNDARGRKRRTAVVMVFAPSARRMELEVGHHGRLSNRRIKLGRISDTRAKRAGIEAVGYWSHAFAGIVCIGRLTVYDGSNEQISDTGPTPCRSP